MVDTRPDAYFDETGECLACIAYRKRPEIDWDARKQELTRILDGAKGKVVVASSGGKDSTWICLELLKLGAKVTVVTATTDHLTDIGKRNIQNLARYADTIEVTPNQTVRRKIARIGLRQVGDISYGEHLSIWTTPMRMAVKLNTPLVFYGECPQNEIAGPQGTEQAQIMDRRWISEHGGLLGMRAHDLVGQDGITERDIEPYLLPSPTEMETVKAYFLGQFLPWDGLHNAVVAREHGFEWYHTDVEGSIGRFESLDNAQTGIHEWFKMLKFSYMRPTDMASLAIRRERMTRDEALELVAEREVFPVTYIGVRYEEVLARIGVSHKEFVGLCRKFTNFDLFEDDQLAWRAPRRKVPCLSLVE
jgi:N-acetyl sugar amidotransferase